MALFFVMRADGLNGPITIAKCHTQKLQHSHEYTTDNTNNVNVMVTTDFQNFLVVLQYFV